MKKCIVILSGLFASMVWAKPALVNSSNVENIDESLSKQLKAYVILDNDIHRCYFREIWNEPDKVGDILERWGESEQELSKFNLYTRIFYRLPYAKLPHSIIEKMAEGELRDELNVPPLSEYYEKYRKKTSIKTDKDCTKIGEFLFHDLLINY